MSLETVFSTIAVRLDVHRGSASRVEDRVVVEEPLEIRIFDETIAITMRTPGFDRELALGFLVSEGIVRSRDDVVRLSHCGTLGDAGYGNVIVVGLTSGVKLPVDENGELVRRGTLVSSACGVCGRKSLDDLFARAVPLRDDSRWPAKLIARAMAGLSSRQPVFESTGGCHAASLVTTDGEPLATFEDIGRHNAVDKVVGSQCLLDALHRPGRLLVVSGRASFEIVQKALSAGISAVASVSAPSSLAVSLAREANMVLCGFVRGPSLVVYAGDERVTSQ